MGEDGTVLMETVFGSHLYGTDGPTSDRDWKAVVVPPARDILLQRAKPTVVTKTKADATAKNTADDVDVETWALHQFFKLVGEGQTVAMDALFSTADAWVRKPHPLWLEIIGNRRRLLSRRPASFLKYCRDQSQKYGIKGSRVAAARIAAEFFSELAAKKPGLKIVDIDVDWQAVFGDVPHIAFPMIPRPHDPPGSGLLHIEVCGKKTPFTFTVAQAAKCYSDLFAAYGQRALQAERNVGVDWKAVSHAVRIGRQAVELLTTGRVTFPRPEAAHLLAIKRGEKPYAAVAEEIETLLAEVEAASERSFLPDEPDRAFMDDLVVRAYRAEVCR